MVLVCPGAFCLDHSLMDFMAWAVEGDRSSRSRLREVTKIDFFLLFFVSQTGDGENFFNKIICDASKPFQKLDRVWGYLLFYVYYKRIWRENENTGTFFFPAS